MKLYEEKMDKLDKLFLEVVFEFLGGWEYGLCEFRFRIGVGGGFFR